MSMPAASRADIRVYSGDSVLAQTSSTPSSRIRQAALFGSIAACARYGSAYVRVDDVGASASASSASPSSRATTACSPDSSKPQVLGQQLGGAPPLGVAVVPLDVQGAQPALRVVERLADHGDALVDRDDRGHAWLGERRAVVDRGDRRAEPRRVEHDRGQHPGHAHVDRELGGAEDLGTRVDSQPSFGPIRL